MAQRKAKAAPANKMKVGKAAVAPKAEAVAALKAATPVAPKAETVTAATPVAPKTEAVVAPKAAAPVAPQTETAAAPAKAEPVAVKHAAPAGAAPTETKAAAAPAAPISNSNPAKGTRTMNKQINDTIEMNREAADRFQAAFGDVNERAKAAVEKSARIVEEMTDFTRGNVEAIVASSKVAAKGVETLSQEAADFGRRSFEEASATLKSFAEMKSPTDFFRLQSEFARAQFDALVAESSKVSEAVIKLAGEVAEPLTSRYSVAADRVKAIAL